MSERTLKTVQQRSALKTAQRRSDEGSGKGGGTGNNTGGSNNIDAAVYNALKAGGTLNAMRESGTRRLLDSPVMQRAQQEYRNEDRRGNELRVRIGDMIDPQTRKMLKDGAVSDNDNNSNTTPDQFQGQTRREQRRRRASAHLSHNKSDNKSAFSRGKKNNKNNEDMSSRAKGFLRRIGLNFGEDAYTPKTLRSHRQEGGVDTRNLLTMNIATPNGRPNFSAIDANRERAQRLSNSIANTVARAEMDGEVEVNANERDAIAKMALQDAQSVDKDYGNRNDEPLLQKKQFKNNEDNTRRMQEPIPHETNEKTVPDMLTSQDSAQQESSRVVEDGTHDRNHGDRNTQYIDAAEQRGNVPVVERHSEELARQPEVEQSVKDGEGAQQRIEEIRDLLEEKRAKNMAGEAKIKRLRERFSHLPDDVFGNFAQELHTLNDEIARLEAELRALEAQGAPDDEMETKTREHEQAVRAFDEKFSEVSVEAAVLDAYAKMKANEQMMHALEVQLGETKRAYEEALRSYQDALHKKEIYDSDEYTNNTGGDEVKNVTGSKGDKNGESGTMLLEDRSSRRDTVLLENDSAKADSDTVEQYSAEDRQSASKVDNREVGDSLVEKAVSGTDGVNISERSSAESDDFRKKAFENADEEIRKAQRVLEAHEAREAREALDAAREAYARTYFKGTDEQVATALEAYRSARERWIDALSGTAGERKEHLIAERERLLDRLEQAINNDSPLAEKEKRVVTRLHRKASKEARKMRREHDRLIRTVPEQVITENGKKLSVEDFARFVRDEIDAMQDELDARLARAGVKTSAATLVGQKIMHFINSFTKRLKRSHDVVADVWEGVEDVWDDDKKEADGDGGIDANKDVVAEKKQGVDIVEEKLNEAKDESKVSLFFDNAVSHDEARTHAIAEGVSSYAIGDNVYTRVDDRYILNPLVKRSELEQQTDLQRESVDTDTSDGPFEESDKSGKNDVDGVPTLTKEEFDGGKELKAEAVKNIIKLLRENGVRYEKIANIPTKEIAYNPALTMKEKRFAMLYVDDAIRQFGDDVDLTKNSTLASAPFSDYLLLIEKKRLLGKTEKIEV